MANAAQMLFKSVLATQSSDIRILLLEGLNQTGQQILTAQGYTLESHPKALSKQVLMEKIKGVHAIGIRSKTLLTQEVLDCAENLIVIGCFCIGTNQVTKNNQRSTCPMLANLEYLSSILPFQTPAL
jgi:phosphoglycerate dehydrogenase-like enzyme